MLGGFGFQQKPLDIVEKYCPKMGEWSQLPVFIFYIIIFIKIKSNNRTLKKKSLTKKRRYAASAAIGKCLYIIGGKIKILSIN